MKSLGKIGLFFLLTTSVFANVIAKVSPDIVYAGDTATYTLTLSGENIKQPNISSICGNDIISTGSQTSVMMINGNYKKSYTLTYNFVPRKSCLIDPTEVEINSKIEKSNSINLEVKPMSQDLSADFVLFLDTSKKDLYVGEPFDLTFTLKQKIGTQVVDSKFIAPDFKGFWIKEEGKPQRINDGGYVVTKVLYKLSAQRDGNLSIAPAQIKIATNVGSRNSWGAFMPQVRWKSYYSNELNVKVKPLPNGAKIIGDFEIQAVANKLKINANEAVNVTLKVIGDGNLEDIESFKPYINSVNVFDEKVVINGNELSQKLAFVSDSNFTIPSFSLSYFSTKTNRIETVKTEPIDIVVNGSSKQAKLEIKRDTAQHKSIAMKSSSLADKSIDIAYLIVAFVVGLSVGILFMFLKSYKFSKKSKKIDIKDEKLLLIKLLPFKDDKDVKKIVDIIESNLYSNKKEPIDKKDLNTIIQRHNIF